MAEDVGDTAAEQQEAAIAQHIGAHRPLQGGGLEPEFGLDGWKRDPDGRYDQADEEIGVPADAIRLVGTLSTLWIPVSNFVVTPVIAIADRRPAFRLAAREVAALLELPLAHLRDATRVQWTHGRRISGHAIDYPFIELEGHHVWGATAMMLSELACLFDPNHAPPPRP